MSIIFNNKFDLSKYLGQGQMLVSSHELKVRSSVFINHSSSATRIDWDDNSPFSFKLDCTIGLRISLK